MDDKTLSDLPLIRDFKPFLGYGPEDYEPAKAFYQAIGFEMLWANGPASEFDTGIGHRFLVTRHEGAGDMRARAGMMNLWVDSVDEWQTYLGALDLSNRFPGVRIADPEITEWGLRILYLWDPGGWLWHIAEPADDSHIPHGA